MANENVVLVKVPDIGAYDNVDVIDIAVKIGSKISVDDPLITLETDKATMDVPSTVQGEVVKVFVKFGDKVSKGDKIVDVLVNDSVSSIAKSNESLSKDKPVVNEDKTIDIQYNISQNNQQNVQINNSVDNLIVHDDKVIHAGPAARKLARELGVDLAFVNGSGNKNRIVTQDVKDYVKNNFQTVPQVNNNLSSGLDLLPWPVVDFSQYGEIESKKLSKIQKLSSMNLHRNWVKIPHVTQHDDADFTESEEFRKILNNQWQKDNLKCSPLVLIIKAITYALKIFPEFNSSLVGDDIILKKYYNIGFAADTPNGLVVPVIKDVDKKGLKEIAIELTDLSFKARLNKLSILEMQGATFTISSLGGIGGTYFTPIINAPEVAILGVCKNKVKPVYNGKDFIPRLKCPLSLSYDHRVIDGALACKFITYLSDLLSDIRKILV